MVMNGISQNNAAYQSLLYVMTDLALERLHRAVDLSRIQTVYSEGPNLRIDLKDGETLYTCCKGDKLTLEIPRDRDVKRYSR